jgi:DNA repair protein RadC
MKNKKYNQDFWNDLKSGKFASMVKETAKGKKVAHPEEVYNILKPLFAKDDDVEQLYCIFLNTKNQILKIEKLFQGSINCSMVHCRELIKKVLEYKAVSIILWHNHPSGNTEPSKEDIIVTEKIESAMNAIDGNLLDHIVVGNGYTSIINEKLSSQAKD